jgi:hypothetical protein
MYELANASLDMASTSGGLLRTKQLDPIGAEPSSSSLDSSVSIHSKPTTATLAETFSGTTFDRSVPEERQDTYHDGHYDDQYYKREGVSEYEDHQYQDNQYQHDDRFPHGDQYQHQHQQDGQYQYQDQHGGQYQHHAQYQDQYQPQNGFDQEIYQHEEAYQQQEMQYAGAMYQNQVRPQLEEEDWATSSVGSDTCGSKTLETTGSRTLNTNLEAAVARPSTYFPRQQEMTPPRQMEKARSNTNLDGQSPRSHSSSPLHSVGSSESGSSWGGSKSRDLSLIDSAYSRDSDVLEDGTDSDTDDETVEMPRTIAEVLKIVKDCNLNTTSSSFDDDDYTEFEFQQESKQPRSSTKSGKAKSGGKKGKESNVERLFNRVSALGEEFLAASSKDSRDSRRRSRGDKTPRRRKDADPATKIMASLVSFEDVSMEHTNTRMISCH